mmetsp:Transcript_6892/g.14717  ORF Transcript_6892/g.14717 Transcript_6892/m.14717 type:complete len:346 (+) Transcript_6892:84-1121(+)
MRGVGVSFIGTPLTALKNSKAAAISRRFFFHRPMMRFSSATRTVLKTIPTRRLREGGGFIVRRPSITPQDFDPFLMIDHLGPTTYPPGGAIGAPDHPHRGQETVTYILQGSMQHRDSAGHHGTLSPGDVQWMTAGRGVVHAEMPADDVMRQGGTVEGFQLWVNLPRAHKLAPPRYQQIDKTLIPVVSRSEKLNEIRVICGEAGDEKGPAESEYTRACLFDVRLGDGEACELAVPHTRAFVYVYAGEGAVCGTKGAVEGELLLLSESQSGETVALEASSGQELHALVLGGDPHKESIAWRGPFVMNTMDEIQRAIRDFHAGQLGQIPGAAERFKATRQAAARQPQS